MASKHFINDGTTLVRDALKGLALTNPNLLFDKENKAIINSHHDGNKNITLIAGGGAGHEPCFAAFVGDGLLSAAVSGNVFASPSVSQIESTVRRTGGTAGTLLVIMNYTGDVLHFHLAAEKARVAGHDTAVLVVGDDVSVGRKRSCRVGRRGLAGTVLVHKILGAMASEGDITVEDLRKAGESIVANMATVGAALDHVHLPGRVDSGVEVGKDQVELGMGIHNEPGCRVLKPQPDVADLVDQMLDQLVNPHDPDRAYVSFSDAKDLILLVNNLGGVSQLEFCAIVKVVVERLDIKSLQPIRLYAGAFMTSLDSKGFSITLLKASKDMVRYLDSPTSAPGWSVPPIPASSWSNQRVELPQLSLFEGKSVNTCAFPLKVDISSFSKSITQACATIIAAEAEIDRFDSVVGDGDCGSTLSRAARAILQDLGSTIQSGNVDALQAVENIAQLVEDNMDGTSGALYAIFLNALAAALREIGQGEDNEQIVSQAQWAHAASEALEGLQKATPARMGDRTLMDALEPFISSLSTGASVAVALSRAQEGRDKTRGMSAVFGRAVYVPEAGWDEVPDPGAAGIACLLEGLLLNY